MILYKRLTIFTFLSFLVLFYNKKSILYIKLKITKSSNTSFLLKLRQEVDVNFKGDFKPSMQVYRSFRFQWKFLARIPAYVVGLKPCLTFCVPTLLRASLGTEDGGCKLLIIIPQSSFLYIC